MQKLFLQLNEINIDNLQINKEKAQPKGTGRSPNSNRTLMRQYPTKEALEECLQTLDIFKEILEDPVQKSKLIRDVIKNIRLKAYDKEGFIYSKGDISQSIYLVIKGEVSLCLPIIKSLQEPQNKQQRQTQYDYRQIDIYREGVGFGEAEFIHGKKRGLAAKTRKDGTVIGSINADGFQQIIQLYRQRVYYKKMEMFNKCPLLQHLQPYQLQFIVNNAKPQTFAISKKIVSKGQKAKALYLITSGKIQLKRQQITKNQQDKKVQLKSVTGVLEEGGFLGDCQLALSSEFSCDAICKSEKVKLYICDQRIIMSQLTPQILEMVNEHYSCQISYREEKLFLYRKAKSKIQKQMVEYKEVLLNQNQIKIKRKINNRYLEKTPSLIGSLSPGEIQKIIKIKYARIRTESSKNKYQDDKIFSFAPLNQIQRKKLHRDQRALSPLLKKLKQSQNKEERQQKKMNQPSLQYSLPLKHNYVKFQFQHDWTKLNRPSKPLLLLMKPFHKRLQSLHQRLSHDSQTKMCKKKQSQQINKLRQQRHLSISQMRRLSQFVSKIQSKNKT